MLQGKKCRGKTGERQRQRRKKKLKKDEAKGWETKARDSNGIKVDILSHGVLNVILNK